MADPIITGGRGSRPGQENWTPQARAEWEARNKGELPYWDQYKQDNPGLAEYLPATAESMYGTMGEYQDWARGEQPVAPDVTSYFEGAAPDYTARDEEGNLIYGQDWTDLTPKYEAMSPDITGYEYSTPEIDKIEDVSGLPEEIWNKISRGEEMATRQGWKGQREQVAQQLAREGEGRRGLGATLMSGMASGEESAVAKARQAAAIQRALQEVGIATGTQALKAARGTSQAGLEQRSQEAQAAELARTQGISIDEARFKLGLTRQHEEDIASEKQKAYEAKYGKAQDVAGLMGTQHQQEMSDYAQQGQGLLSGAQLAQGATSQAGTYDIQKDTPHDTGYWQGASNVGQKPSYSATQSLSTNKRSTPELRDPPELTGYWQRASNVKKPTTTQGPTTGVGPKASANYLGQQNAYQNARQLAAKNKLKEGQNAPTQTV